MVAPAYAMPAHRINAKPRLPLSFLNGWPDARPPSPGRLSLLAMLPIPGDIVDIDPALDAIERHRPDPYVEIVAAIDDGLIVAEFAAPPKGSTLRSIVLRRL